jgi:hypothetical protein
MMNWGGATPGNTPSLQQLLAMPSDLTPIPLPDDHGQIGFGGTPQLFSMAGNDPAANGWTNMGTPYSWSKNGTRIQQYGSGNQWQVDQSASPELRALVDPSRDPYRYFTFAGPTGSALIDIGSYGYTHGLPADPRWMNDSSNVASGFVGRAVGEAYPPGTRVTGGVYYYPGQVNSPWGGQTFGYGG